MNVDNASASNTPPATESCCGPAGYCELSRRDFVAGASMAAALTVVGQARRGSGAITRRSQPGQLHPSHAVPVEKGLDRAWFDGLKQRGGPRIYADEELAKIGMPIGGIATGQLYLGGDGRLLHWDIFNRHDNTGPGIRGYLRQELAQPVEQGFALRVSAGGEAVVRSLDASGFADVRFVGEYPIGRVEYRDPQVPVEVTLTAFSPFIPLNAEDSALPVTVMRFALKNASDREVEASLAGWLANAVCAQEPPAGNWRSEVMRGEGLSFVQMSFEPDPVKPLPGNPRPAVVFADFEGDDYGNWTAEGAAVGRGPVRGNLPGQQTVSGFEDQGLVNTFLGGDEPTGKLASHPFRISHRYINFKVGGGEDVQKLGLRLVVGGQVVRTAAGRNREALQWTTWPVEEFVGRGARLEIVDEANGPWGHINIDQIEFSDEPRVGPVETRQRGDFGTMGLGVIGGHEGLLFSAILPDGERPAVLFGRDPELLSTGEPKVDMSIGGESGGHAAIGRVVAIAPGETREVTLLVAWHFANLNPGGRFYANRFEDAHSVAAYVAENLERLDRQTRLWHDTYYDSTLPHWLLDRLHMPISILASSTCQWWKNGRFWAWEGVGCCAGTCTHVWNYEQAMARLFPQLEQSVRAMQDFGAGFQPDSGLVGFRGESHVAYAADGQAGTILKAYREHLCSPDDAFLKQHWPSIRKALEFLFAHDANLDGVIENQQHNTYDIEFYGPNTFVGALYLAALRAAEKMAEAMGEAELAASCRGAYERGSQYSMRQLFNGEYFIQRVDWRQHPWFQYGDGCLADQLFGQNWAHQLGLGHLYPAEAVKTAMGSIWKYNWAPDVGPQNKVHPPERVFAAPGEPGLFICTWPRSEHPGERGVRYRDEVWTGIEYEVAAGLIYEGLLDEGLAVVRAVDERYDAKKRNPWNEIECGDHYARAMASWGVLLALSGFECDGPAGRLAMNPRITPEDFRCCFTTAQGWGTISQKRTGGEQEHRVEMRYGQLRLKEFAATISFPRSGQVAVTLNGATVKAAVDWPGNRAVIGFSEPISLKAGDGLGVRITAPVP